MDSTVTITDLGAIGAIAAPVVAVIVVWLSYKAQLRALNRAYAFQTAAMDRERRSNSYADLLMALRRFEGRVYAYLEMQKMTPSQPFALLTVSQRLLIISNFESAMGHIGASQGGLANLADTALDPVRTSEYCTNCEGAMARSIQAVSDEFKVALIRMKFGHPPPGLEADILRLFSDLDAKWVNLLPHDRAQYLVQVQKLETDMQASL